jgi:hypothetical protein
MTTKLKLGTIPSEVIEALQGEYLEIKKRYALNDWGPGQLKGGRFAEAVLRALQHLLGAPITPLGTDITATGKEKILNAVKIHPAIDDHVRQKVVPLTRLLLDFRNNRDSAHLGGFDANDMDTLFVTTAATWIFCELIRVYGGYQMPDAQRIVDGLAVKDYPVLMEFDGDTFITRPDLSAKQEVLVVLNKFSKADFDFLFSKTKDGNSTRFRSTLGNMVTQKLIGRKDGQYFLMPKGVQAIQSESLLAYV